MRIVARSTVIIALLAVALTGGFSGIEASAQAAGAKAEGDNPAPFINALSPSAAAIGGPDFTLTVDGSGFLPGSHVRWNGEPRATTYLSAGQLAAQIPAAAVAEAQTASVTVYNPLPGGGESPPVLFAVQAPNPLPDVTGLSPAHAMVGDGAFGLTVIGSGFVPGSIVLWNGEDRTTGFINEFMLAATIRASDTLAVGTAFVSVLNPAPGGGQSLSARVFTIVYPAPTMQLLEPAAVWAGGPAFTLAVTGSRFTPVSVVQWAGVDRPTVYVSPERLEAQIFAAEIAHPGAPSVRVFTPGPGGGLSTPLPADVRADDVPPVTVVSGLKGVWHGATTKFTLMATDVGLGVEWTYYRLGRFGDLKDGPTVVVPAPKDHSNDGMHTVVFYSVDKVDNLEAPKSVQVGIDTRPPVTTVAAAKVGRGGTLRPKYRVDDAMSTRALDARLTVSTPAGKVVLRCDLGQPATRTWRTGSACRVTLPKGTYRMRVLAHDLAGNAQSGTKSGTLTVY